VCVCVCVMLQTLKQNNSRLENRTQLVTLSHVRMGPKVFINCAGFIKIDTKELSDRYTTHTHIYTATHNHFTLHTTTLLLHVVVSVFSERELMFMFAICRRPSVCRLSSVVCL